MDFRSPEHLAFSNLGKLPYLALAQAGELSPSEPRTPAKEHSSSRVCAFAQPMARKGTWIVGLQLACCNRLRFGDRLVKMSCPLAEWRNEISKPVACSTQPACLDIILTVELVCVCVKTISVPSHSAACYGKATLSCRPSLTNPLNVYWVMTSRTARSSVLEDQAIVFGLSDLACSEF